jgi:hypothetical protein
MADFGWAYINCGTLGSAFGPTGSVQFMSGSNDTTGTLNFMYHTAAYASYAPNTMVLTGTLVVSGTISASNYHIEDVTRIDSSGSTRFGNTNDDTHIRTGSMFVGEASTYPLFTVSTTSDQIIFSGSGHRVNYTNIAVSSYTSSGASHMLGITATGDVQIRLHSASTAGIGQVIVIKDEVTVRTGVISVSSSSPNNIEGNSYYELSGTMPAINLYTNGTDWFVY